MLVSTADGTLLAGERAPDIPFLGGYLSFPGGRVEDEDRALAAKHLPDDELGVRKIAGLRELEEESGLTLAGGRASDLRPGRALRSAARARGLRPLRAGRTLGHAALRAAQVRHAVLPVRRGGGGRRR